MIDADDSQWNQFFVDGLSVTSHRAKYNSRVITCAISFSHSAFDFQGIIYTFQQEEFIYLHFDSYVINSKLFSFRYCVRSRLYKNKSSTMVIVLITGKIRKHSDTE
jgi:hypothetical protein